MIGYDVTANILNFILWNGKASLKGVIHLVRTHEGGEGGQANAYECVQGGRGG